MSSRRQAWPVTLREYLTLMEAMDAKLASGKVEDFYYLARTSLVKDERNLDKFDRVFGHVFKGLEALPGEQVYDIPEEWLKLVTEKFLTEEEKAQIEALGGWEKIMEELQKRLEEQDSRHEGGSKWIGTGGTSPFGAYGYNPAGVRIGQKEGRHGRAIKVWDKREYKDLDDSLELGTRNIKVALRRLRKFARDGAPEELDLDDTIKSTASKGWLDIKLVPERRNTVKVLLFFDIGGSMDGYVRACEELFSRRPHRIQAHGSTSTFTIASTSSCGRTTGAATTNAPTPGDVLHTYPHDYKVIFVGDASMSPFELTHPGGSVEHMNSEAGSVWLQRITQIYESAIWLNPTPEKYWGYTPSIDLIKQLFSDRMFPLTLEGLDGAMKELGR